jgi:hypothetical protein
MSFCLCVLSFRRVFSFSRPSFSSNCFSVLTIWQSISASQWFPRPPVTPQAAMQIAGQPSAALCNFLRHAHPWCHQCLSVLISSFILSDTDLSRRGNGPAALFSAPLRIYIFSSPVDSTYFYSSTFVLLLGTQLHLDFLNPCPPKCACYRFLGLQTFRIAGCAPRWLIAASPWLPPLVPRLPHAHRTARLAARSGAVFSHHSTNHQSIYARTYSLRVLARIDLATSDTWSRLIILRGQQLCLARLIGCTSAYWRGFGL